MSVTNKEMFVHTDPQTFEYQYRVYI